MVSPRAEIITRRTYNRPIFYGSDEFETWEDTCDRVIEHQRWLWERALTSLVLPNMPLHDITEDMWEWVGLNKTQELELEELRELMYERKALPSGRTLWLGGTDISKRREASQFNCAHTVVETVYDITDVFWLLLNGCGVGFTPVVGTLTGFKKPIKNIEIIHTKRTEKGGRATNEETFHDGVWTLSVGDSAEAWAKTMGKLMAGKYDAHTIVFDFSQLRPEGIRLKGYGWISSGDIPLSKACKAIAEIMSKRAGSHLRKMDILDIINWLGTVLSSRRSAQIALVDYGSDEWYEFATAKKYCYDEPFKHRQQSNNSLVFYQKPTREQLEEVFDIMIDSGGSEPGIINGETAKKRAPWFKGVNPCGEILLGNKSFCNLVERNDAAFKDDIVAQERATWIIARANYRQTVVDLRDGILQESWHLNNEFLRLCGVGSTGISQRDDMTEYEWKNLRYTAISAARSMADELQLQHPKNVTTVKPSGTLSKIMDVEGEGIHRPLGRYIFNWVQFSNMDPALPEIKKAKYRWLAHPTDPTGTLVCFPICNKDSKLTKKIVTRKDGNTEELEVNLDSALEQLGRYKKLQMYYCDQNVSNTISYDVEEKDDIIDWLLRNWDVYVGVSFLFRADPTLSAKDLGFNYLPQEVVTKERYDDYVSELQEVILDDIDSYEEMDIDECAGGACPVK